MVVNQIYNLVNDVNSQLWGETALGVHDLTGLIALGDTVFSSADNRDLYLGELVDRIGKSVLRNLDLEVEFPNFMKNTFEWGAILQKINIMVTPASSNESWRVGANDFTSNQFKVDKPTVVSRLFSDTNTWEYDITIPDKLFKSAFLSASAMGAFIDGIMSSMVDSLTLAINNMAHMSLVNLVAEKKKANNACYDALALYNETLTTPISRDKALVDKEFWRFFGMFVRNQIKYMEQPSKLFNIGTGDNDAFLRVTARDNMHVLASADAMSYMSSYLYAQDFNYRFDEMPLYKEWVSLQAQTITGATDNPTFESNTSINVKPSSGGDAIELSGVAVILADRQAIGTFYEDMDTSSDRNNRNKYTNFTSDATIGYFNDLSENICVIYIGEGETT